MRLHPSTKRMSRYLDGVLPERAARRFEAHLARCEKCRRKVELLQSAVRALRLPERVGQVGNLSQVGQIGNLSPLGLSSNIDGSQEIDGLGQVANLSYHWNTNSPILGEIQSVEGTVLIRAGANDKPIEAFPGCALREGDRLEPVAGASAVIEWEDGRTLHITEPTDLNALAVALAAVSGDGHDKEPMARTQSFLRRHVWASVAAAAAAVVLLGSIVVLNSAGRTRQVRIIGAVDQWPVEYYGGNVDWAALVGKTLYLRKTPTSKGGGSYAGSLVVANEKSRRGNSSGASGFDMDGDPDFYVDNPTKDSQGWPIAGSYTFPWKAMENPIVLGPYYLPSRNVRGVEMNYNGVPDVLMGSGVRAPVRGGVGWIPWSYGPVADSAKAAERPTPLKPPAATPTPTATPAPKTAADSQTEKRLVIYTAQFSILVGSVEDSMKELTKKIDEWKGYVQTTDLRRVTFRVPAATFDRAVEGISQLGVVINKQVQSQDVTAQCRDLQLRMEVAEASRQRLMELLKKADKTEDLLKIENEIRRLTEEIERMKGELRTLGDRIAYSTLTVELTAKAAEAKPARPTRAGASYFAWINQIGAENVLRNF